MKPSVRLPNDVVAAREASEGSAAVWFDADQVEALDVRPGNLYQVSQLGDGSIKLVPVELQAVKKGAP